MRSSNGSGVGKNSLGKIDLMRMLYAMSSISKPDKTVFCSLAYSLFHNILLVIYSENKDFPRYILLEKHLRSLDILVNLFERMKAHKKLIIHF